MLHKLIYTLVLLYVTIPASAQENNIPFHNDILAFRKHDSINPPSKGAILFIGSSSFTMWADLQKDFPGYRIINRGFGGSSLTDQIRFANDIIFPYQPKQIVIYCGENDLAGNDTVTGQTVYNRFRVLFTMIREKLPNVPILFVSLKPSPSRAHLFAKMKVANSLIREFLSKQRSTGFVDVYSLMLVDGKPRTDIFLSDSLHMNPNGYAIWKKAIQPHLLK
jgi:lysophospholipase L1-like esterase